MIASILRGRALDRGVGGVGLNEEGTEVVLDLRGLWCPEPVLRAKTALRGLPPGGAVVLECTDPLTEIDVPHFARQTGHRLAAQERRPGGLYVFRIVKVA